MKTRNTRKTERLNCARVGAIASAGARRIETMPTRRDVKSSCREGGKQQQGCFALYIINNREENLLQYTLPIYNTQNGQTRARERVDELAVEGDESNPLRHENFLLIFNDIHWRSPRSIERRESISFVRLHRPSIVLVHV